MSALRATVASLALLTAVWGGADAQVDVTRPVAQLGDNSPCIPPQPTLNITLVCDLPNNQGNTAWLLGDYPLLDRDEFEPRGVQQMASTQGSSSLLLRPEGQLFLLDSFGTTVTFSCVNVLNSFNTAFSKETLRLYRGVLPVLEPTWEVIDCYDNGILTLRITYQRLSDDDQVCVPDMNAMDVNYRLTLSNGVSRDYRGGEGEGDITWEGNVSASDSIGLMATMQVTADIYTQTTTTQLTGVVCHDASWRIYECDNVQRIDVQCNVIEGADEDVGCQISNSDPVLTVSDTFNDNSVIGQSTVPAYDGKISCSRDSGADELSDEAIYAVTGVGGGLLGFGIGAAITAPVYYVFLAKSKPFM